MNTVGFVRSKKNNELRRAILPCDLDKVDNPQLLYFEEGYAEALGYSDANYLEKGANICARSEVIKCDIIVDVKLGDADYLDELEESKILCGWAHAVQNIVFTDLMINQKHTVLAWEELYKHGQYVFYRNRELAGEAAVLHAFRYCGKMPYDCNIAIIGNGKTSKGVQRILKGIGAIPKVYSRVQEKEFRENYYLYDVIINCVLWDTKRTDRLLYRDDLKNMKKGSLIIDVSCDPYLEIETSHPTTIDEPVYIVDDIIHYAVDNTPAMYPITVTKTISNVFAPYINELVSGHLSEELEQTIVINNGIIIDSKIKEFRLLRGIDR